MQRKLWITLVAAVFVLGAFFVLRLDGGGAVESPERSDAGTDANSREVAFAYPADGEANARKGEPRRAVLNEEVLSDKDDVDPGARARTLKLRLVDELATTPVPYCKLAFESFAEDDRLGRRVLESDRGGTLALEIPDNCTWVRYQVLETRTTEFFEVPDEDQEVLLALDIGPTFFLDLVPKPPYVPLEAAIQPGGFDWTPVSFEPEFWVRFPNNDLPGAVTPDAVLSVRDASGLLSGSGPVQSFRGLHPGYVIVEMVQERGLFITGIVLDSSGAPAPRCRVSARGLLGIREADTDGEGRFRIGPLPTGTWLLSAGIDLPGEEIASIGVKVESGDANVILRLRRSGRVAVRIVGADGRVPSVGEIIVRRVDDVVTDDPRGSGGNGEFRLTYLIPEFRLTHVIPGKYRVIASSLDGYFGYTSAFEVAPGDMKEVVVDLERGATLDLHYEGPGEEAYFELFASEVLVEAGFVGRDEQRTVTAPAGAVELRLGESQQALPMRTFFLRVGEHHSESWGDSD